MLGGQTLFLNCINLHMSQPTDWKTFHWQITNCTAFFSELQHWLRNEAKLWSICHSLYTCNKLQRVLNEYIYSFIYSYISVLLCNHLKADIFQIHTWNHRMWAYFKVGICHEHGMCVKILRWKCVQFWVDCSPYKKSGTQSHVDQKKESGERRPRSEWQHCSKGKIGLPGSPTAGRDMGSLPPFMFQR